MKDIEIIVEYWDNRMKKEAQPVFDKMGSYYKPSLLASDMVWSIRRTEMKGKEITPKMSYKGEE